MCQHPTLGHVGATLPEFHALHEHMMHIEAHQISLCCHGESLAALAKVPTAHGAPVPPPLPLPQRMKHVEGADVQWQVYEVGGPGGVRGGTAVRVCTTEIQQRQQRMRKMRMMMMCVCEMQGWRGGSQHGWVMGEMKWWVRGSMNGGEMGTMEHPKMHWNEDEHATVVVCRFSPCS